MKKHKFKKGEKVLIEGFEEGVIVALLKGKGLWYYVLSQSNKMETLKEKDLDSYDKNN